MIAGAITFKIRQKRLPPFLSSIYFDLRKIRHLGAEKWAKAYYWKK